MPLKGNALLAALFSLWLTGCQIDVNLPDVSDNAPGDTDSSTEPDPSDDDTTPHDRADAEDWQCDADQLRGVSDEAFAPSVAAAPTHCVNDLFSLTGPMAGELFAQKHMMAVGQLIETDATPEADLEAALLFLRAGYYVQWYHKDDVGDYDETLRAQTRRALSAVLTDERLNRSEPGGTLPEAVTLIDSAGLNADFLPTVTQLLNDYSGQRENVRDHTIAVNNGFTVLFRGHQNDDFKAAVQADPAILTALDTFVGDHEALIGTDRAYLLANAVREYGRFLQYPTLSDRIRPQLAAWLNRFEMTGDSAAVWLAAADMADHFDADHCAYYGICDFQSQLESQVLSFDFDCPSVAVHLRAQNLTTARAYEVCDTLTDQTERFHRLYATGRVPVADDHNDNLNVIVFDSSDDYKTYANLFFGIDTDNGGMYLEGNPADPDNQARFIAYRAEWLDTFAVWNLRHEFTHYLDGRFNVAGTYQDSSAVPTVWWTEGMAEYASHLDDYDEAWRLAESERVPFSQILQTAYSDGTDRVYRWGYLACAYLMSQQPGIISDILADLRAGQFTQYEQYLNQLGTDYDADFNAWLDSELDAHDGGDDDDAGDDNDDEARLVNGETRTGLASPDSDYFYVYLPEGAHNLSVRTTGGTGDLTLYGRNETWPSDDAFDLESGGNGTDTALMVSNPEAGTYYYVRLVGEPDFSGVSLTVTFEE